ncbi:MAG: PQQ-dependent sugar dehydrogenase [Saprospiraceae bacterium]|nr:PQQ-dependent sugar dehydrogenase [Saprospiraceae bacterium]
MAISTKKLFLFIVVITIITPFLGCNQEKKTIESPERPLAFEEHCATCHGSDLRGEIAQSLLDGSWQFGARKGDLFRSIKFGHPHHGMPSWGGVFSDAEIDTLVDYLIAEEKRLGITKPPLPDTLETQDYRVDIEVISEDVEAPWGIAFINDHKALITEKPGRLRIIENGVLRKDSITGIPAVQFKGQGGLLDVYVDPQYEENGWIYLSFSHALEKQESEENAPAMTSIVRGKIQDMAWTNQEILFEAPHETYRTTSHHFGSRIVIDPEGYLYFSIGERGFADDAQDLSKPNGKIHRINRDGSIPTSNPFYHKQGALPSIYSFGHRNPQGLAVHPETGEIWEAEHGPLGGDELNLIKPGRNYGWPVISYGINYNGEIITDLTRKEGMEQPIYYWKPSIAVCGIDFYHGDAFAKWKNQLMVGALRFEEVQLLDVEKDRVMYQQTLLKNGGRVRDVTGSPDGSVYVVLNNPDKIIRLSPKPHM